MWLADASGWRTSTEVITAQGCVRGGKHVAAARSQQALKLTFTAYGEELEIVEVFK
jgi:hypothetical protein